jgi:hypothetical protein
LNKFDHQFRSEVIRAVWRVSNRRDVSKQSEISVTAISGETWRERPTPRNESPRLANFVGGARAAGVFSMRETH